MRRSWELAAIGAALLVPLAALAQAPARGDREYCAQLGGIYEKYIGRSISSPYDDVRRGNVAAQVAVTQCKEGDVTSAIAELKRQLTNNKISLPPRG
jgi:hypothetical protein